MLHKIFFGSQQIPCKIIKSSRARRLGLRFTEGENILKIICPKRVGSSQAILFAQTKSKWILKHWKNTKNIPHNTISQAKYLEYKAQATKKFQERSQYFSQLLGKSFNNITIKDQKTRWGSCSSKGNLNYNWRIIMAPEYVLDYLVAHEVSHLKHMNHSKAFWETVELILPDYKKGQQWLKENGTKLRSIKH